MWNDTFNIKLTGEQNQRVLTSNPTLIKVNLVQHSDPRETVLITNVNTAITKDDDAALYFGQIPYERSGEKTANIIGNKGG